MALGVPFFSSMLENTRIKSAASAFAAGLQLARGNAIARNVPIDFAPNGAGWSINPNGSAEVIDSKSPQESSGNQLQIVNASGIARVVFSGLGAAIFRDAGGAAVVANPAIFSFASPNNACVPDGSARCLDVRITPAGQVRVCDPTIVAAGDTRGC